MKLEDINEGMGFKVTSFVDRDPNKRCDAIISFGRTDGKVMATVIAGYPGSYWKSEPSKPFAIDQQWLDQRKFHKFENNRAFAEEATRLSIHNYMIDAVRNYGGFHISSFHRHDADSRFNLSPDKLDRLYIAKLEKPHVVTLKGGNTIPITHISSAGELIYKAQGLKSVPVNNITLDSLDKLSRQIDCGEVQFAPALEGHLTKNKTKPLVRESSQSYSPSM